MIPYNAQVVKINKRLYVTVPEENWIYTPPDFIYTRLNSRLPLQLLADKIKTTVKASWFHIICEFEASFTKDNDDE